MARKRISAEIEANILVNSRRKCCICFAVHNDTGAKKGQVAHLDQDASNNDPDNLAYLCFDHHDEYDGRTSQSKGLQLLEVKRYRQLLYGHIAQPQPMTMLQRFDELLAIREDENRRLRAELERQSSTVEQLRIAIRHSEQTIAEMRIRVANDPSTAVAETQTLVTEMRGYRILLVEPHAETRRAMRNLLAHYGHDVETPEAYEETFATLQRGDCDIMIAELNLNRNSSLDGNPFDLARYARSRGIACIAVTAFGTDEDRKQSTAAGFSVHLTKPTDLAQLQNAIAHAGYPPIE